MRRSYGSDRGGYWRRRRPPWSSDPRTEQDETGQREGGTSMEPLRANRPARRGPAHRRRRVQPETVRRRRRTVGALAILALAAPLVVAGGLLGTVSHLEGNLATAPLSADGNPVPREIDGAMEVLLIGSDSRDLQQASYGQGDGSRRSDALVLVHLSAEDDRIDAVQLPRDTLMDLPACPDTGSGASRGGRGMLNSALNFGPACTVAAVEELTGVQIDHFMELDFEGFIAIVDALDGVQVCLPEALEDPAADLDLPAGEQVVGGTDALALARTRHAVGDGSDIARLGHQQMVMSAVVQEATSSRVISRPDRLYAFLDATSSSLTVDPGLSRAADLAGLATRASRVDPSHITFATMPWEPAPTDRNRVVPSAEAAGLFAALAADEPVVAQVEDADVPDSGPDETATVEGGDDAEDAVDAEGADDGGGADTPAPGDAPRTSEPEAVPSAPRDTRTADTDLCAG